uniref:Uncharacterized protein n=1 Tax=Arundo donax TaxID=35708 RepID=A0A0A9FAU1_ARUDO
MLLFLDIKGCQQSFGDLDLKQIEILAIDRLNPTCKKG